MKQQQQPTQEPVKERSVIDNIKWNSVNLRESKITSDQIQRILSDKSSSVSRAFGDLSREIYDKGMSSSDDKLRQQNLYLLNRLNNITREFLNKDMFDRDTTEAISFQILNLKSNYENSINQGKQQQGPGPTLLSSWVV